MRAAATVIISSALYCGSAIGPLLRSFAARRRETSPELRKVRRPEHVSLDPGGKALALARDLVPLLVKRIVVLIIAQRVRGKRAAPHLAYRAHPPSGQPHGVRLRGEPIDDLLDRDD